MKKPQYAMIWVHPTFRKKIKIESSQNNMSIVDYTKHLANQKSLQEEFKESMEDNSVKKRFKFNPF